MDGPKTDYFKMLMSGQKECILLHYVYVISRVSLVSARAIRSKCKKCLFTFCTIVSALKQINFISAAWQLKAIQ